VRLVHDLAIDPQLTVTNLDQLPGQADDPLDVFSVDSGRADHNNVETAGRRVSIPARFEFGSSTF
jgi:hypothetical protein